jgi:hypothetical protein
MSDSQPSGDALPPVQPLHYQVLCGIALAAIFLVQLQEGLLLWSMIVLLLGATAVLLRARISPLLIVLALVGGQFYHQYLFPAGRQRGTLQVEDVVLCAATLAYVAGHYRLLALWRNILPLDPRQIYHKRAGVIVPLSRLGKVAPQHRPTAHLSRGELAWFVLQLPLFALLAQAVWIVLGARRELHALSPWLLQLMHATWILVLGLLLVGQLLRVVRLLRMDRVTAQIVLQDTLWAETRREQRRIGRWLAWWKLRRTQTASNRAP